MPQTVTGNADRHPTAVLSSLLAALGAGGLIDDQTGRTGPIQDVADSGSANGGDGGGNLPLVTTVHRHGLGPGERVTLTGTPYDSASPVEVEPLDPFNFYLLNVPFTAASSGGAWS